MPSVGNYSKQGKNIAKLKWKRHVTKEFFFATCLLYYLFSKTVRFPIAAFASAYLAFPL